MKTANRDALPSQMVVPASECASHGAAPCFRRERLHDLGTLRISKGDHDEPVTVVEMEGIYLPERPTGSILAMKIQ